MRACTSLWCCKRLHVFVCVCTCEQIRESERQREEREKEREREGGLDKEEGREGEKAKRRGRWGGREEKSKRDGKRARAHLRHMRTWPRCMQVDHKKLPPPGGFHVWMVSKPRTQRKRTPSEKQPQFSPKNWVSFQGGSFSSGFLVWKAPSKEPPPGWIFFTIKIEDTNLDLLVYCTPL